MKSFRVIMTWELFLYQNNLLKVICYIMITYNNRVIGRYNLKALVKNEKILLILFTTIVKRYTIVYVKIFKNKIYFTIKT